MKKKIIIILVLLALGVGGTFAVLSLQPTESEASNTPITIRAGNLTEVASASGSIEPDVQIDVKSRASGEVVEVRVEEGEEVEVGDVLVRLDPRDAEQRIEEAEMALTRANSDLTQSRANLSVSMAQAEEAQAHSAIRNRGLQLGLISTEDQRASATSADVARANVTLRQAQVRSARTNVESAALRLEEARRRLEEVIIVSPISGTVLSVNIEVGSIVASGITNVNGGTTLLTVADLSDLRVVGAIDEAQVGQVEPGQDVSIRVDAYPDQIFEGRVERISPLGRESSNIVTFDVEIVVTDEDAQLLRSGMSADLEIVTERYEGVPLVPIMAIQSRGQRQFVTLANGERQRIQTGATDGMRLVVLSGLEAGDQITTDAPTKMGQRPGNREKQQSGILPMGRGSRR